MARAPTRAWRELDGADCLFVLLLYVILIMLIEQLLTVSFDVQSLLSHSLGRIAVQFRFEFFAVSFLESKGEGKKERAVVSLSMMMAAEVLLVAAALAVFTGLAAGAAFLASMAIHNKSGAGVTRELKQMAEKTVGKVNTVFQKKQE